MNEYNAASRRHIREAEKAAKAQEAEHLIVVASIMQHKGGRAWMYKKLAEAHIFVSSFTNNALSTAFREGERNIGLRLLAEIMEASPNDYILMMREADERDRTAEQRRSPNGNGRTETEPLDESGDDGEADVRADEQVRGNEVDYGVKA